MHPSDRGGIAFGGHEVLRVARHRREGIVVQLAAFYHGHPFVQQLHQRSGHARLRLPAQAEQIDAVAREDRAFHGRHHRIGIAVNALKERVLGADPCDEVGAQLLLHGARLPSAFFEFAEVLGVHVGAEDLPPLHGGSEGFIKRLSGCSHGRGTPCPPSLAGRCKRRGLGSPR